VRASALFVVALQQLLFLRQSKAIWVFDNHTSRCGTLPGTRATVGVHIATAKEFWTTRSVSDAFTIIILENEAAANLTEIAVRAKKVVICARGLNSREIVGARRKALWVSRETRTRLGTFPGTRVTVGVHIAKAKELWTTVSAFEAFTSIILESSVAANLTEIAVRAKKVVICARGLNSRKFPGARCRDTRTGFATFHHAAPFFRDLFSADPLPCKVRRNSYCVKYNATRRSIKMDYFAGHTTRTDNIQGIDTHL
jgi:hypothetical protein